MFDRFSDSSRRIMRLARQEALRLDRDAIGPEHLLLGLLGCDGCFALEVLKSLGHDPRALRDSVLGRVTAGTPHANFRQVPLRPDAGRVLAFAAESVESARRRLVRSEHVLLALLAVDDHITRAALTEHKVEYDDILERLELLGRLGGWRGAPQEVGTDRQRVWVYQRQANGVIAVAMGEIDHAGGFDFEGFEPGAHSVVVTRGDDRIAVAGLETAAADTRAAPALYFHPAGRVRVANPRAASGALTATTDGNLVFYHHVIRDSVTILAPPGRVRLSFDGPERWAADVEVHARKQTDVTLLDGPAW